MGEVVGTLVAVVAVVGRAVAVADGSAVAEAVDVGVSVGGTKPTS